MATTRCRKTDLPHPPQSLRHNTACTEPSGTHAEMSPPPSSTHFLTQPQTTSTGENPVEAPCHLPALPSPQLSKEVSSSQPRRTPAECSMLSYTQRMSKISSGRFRRSSDSGTGVLSLPVLERTVRNRVYQRLKPLQESGHPSLEETESALSVDSSLQALKAGKKSERKMKNSITSINFVNQDVSHVNQDVNCGSHEVDYVKGDVDDVNQDLDYVNGEASSASSKSSKHTQVDDLSSSELLCTSRLVPSHEVLNSNPPHVHQPESYHDDTARDMLKRKSHPKKSTGSPVRHRQRRSGTVDRPDLSALKVTMSSTRTSREASGSKDHENPPSPDHSWDPCLSITPFPQIESLPSHVKANEDAVKASRNEDLVKSQRALLPRTSQLHQASRVLRFANTRENYWSFRKALPRYNLAAATSNTIIKNPPPPPLPDPPLPVIPDPPRPIRKPETKPLPPRKTHYHCFRYSDAVRGLIKLLDELHDDHAEESILRRVSEILPTLDFEGLKTARRRWKGEGRISVGLDEERMSPSSVVMSHDALEEGRKFVDDWFMLMMSRERSLSVPDILHYQNDARGL